MIIAYSAATKKNAFMQGLFIPEPEPAAITITHEGIICSCNSSAEQLFGWHASELRLCHVSRLIPALADVEWMQEGRPNHRLRFLSRIGHSFNAVDSHGIPLSVKLFINDLNNTNDSTLRLLFKPA